jgi:hypothetical protein
MALPCFIAPLFLQSAPDRSMPFWSRYWVKANVWLAILSFVGNYVWTHYFVSRSRILRRCESWPKQGPSWPLRLTLLIPALAPFPPVHAAGRVLHLSVVAHQRRPDPYVPCHARVLLWLPRCHNGLPATLVDEPHACPPPAATPGDGACRMLQRRWCVCFACTLTRVACVTLQLAATASLICCMAWLTAFLESWVGTGGVVGRCARASGL